MRNPDLDWLAAQQPQQTAGDHSARQRALRALVQHTRARPGRRSFRLGNPFGSPAFGFLAIAGAVAVAAALVLSLSGARPGDGTLGGGQPQITQGPQALVHHHHTTGSSLVRLADYVGASGPPSGDATLVARTTAGGGHSVTVYDLYADNGQYFFSQTEGGLAGQVSAHHNLAGGLFAREIAAAKLAATGNVQTAAEDLADAPDPSEQVPQIKTQTLSAGDASKEPGTLHAGEVIGTRYDNYVWENSQDALIAGSGDPQVRAGVLRILATLPDVTVTHGTADGQPTLTLTAGTDELGPGFAEQLTINANSGVPIQSAGGPPGGTPAATVDYKVSRVTLANLPSGTGNGE